MTTRSNQWYTKASRLPNSLPNVSIGPLPSLTLSRHQDHGIEDRWKSSHRLRCERFSATPSVAEGASADFGRVSDHGELASRRVVRIDDTTPPIVGFDRGESGRGMRTQRRCGTRA